MKWNATIHDPRYSLPATTSIRISENRYKINGEFMAIIYGGSRLSSEWKEVYKAALFEEDHDKIPQRIADAEQALMARAHELFPAGLEQAREQDAIENAMYFLRVLASAAGVDSCTQRCPTNQA
jgi:hypothetical protein